MGKILNIISHSDAETTALAAKLVTYFKSGDVIVLEGRLGAGKTVFVKGLAKALGIEESLVNSPSFTLVNEYPGKQPLYHFDLYRLEDPNELYEIGWDEYSNREGILVVEWGEKAKEYLPERYYLIRFTVLGETDRQLEISFVEP